ncbi:P-loop containing nucleoside triphosphate hydrolase protein, partial [Chytriomyces cf. hyalinus JEL632]
APRVFAFDHIFGCDSTQSGVYEGCVKILVQRFVAGFNATVLAYGQTGSGKTWTMGTGLEASSAVMNDSVGIVPRAISDMFSLLAEKENTRFSLFVSFLELYNEDIVDLLNPSTVVNARRPSSAASSASSINASISIREDARGNIVFGGVREEPVSSPADMLSLLQKGSLCRATGSTDMNAASSRSHAIFSIILKQHQSSQPLASAEPESSISSTSTLTSKFHFVDLAGSERLKRTNALGDRKKEGISINQGLLALGNVISALGNTEDSSETSTHVPYRDSKLTRMLQDSLGGNSQTLMIACVSPSDLSYGETVSTLTYANRARNIKNKAVVNRD